MTEREKTLLDKYHKDILTSEERSEFNSLLENESFAEIVQLSIDVEKVVVLDRQQAFRKKLPGWQSEQAAKKSRTGSRKTWHYFVALLLLCGLACLVVRTIQNKKDSPERIFIAYAVPYKNIHLPVSRSEADTSAEYKAMAAYEQQKYEQSFAGLSQLPSSKSNEGVVFYKAVNLIQLNRVAEAKLLLLNLLNSQKYGQPSKWYLFLIAVKEENKRDIKRYSGELKNQNSHKKIRTKVEEVLSKI